MGRIKDIIMEREEGRRRKYHPDIPESEEAIWEDILKDQEPFPWDLPEPIDDDPECACPNWNYAEEMGLTEEGGEVK